MAFIKILSLLTALVLSAGLGINDTSDDISVVTPMLKTPDVVDTTVSTTEILGFVDIDGSYVFNAEQAQLTIATTTGPQPSGAELSMLAPSISCNLDVQWVHGSNHVQGTINGVAVITCSGAAGGLALHYSLIRTTPNYTQWGAGLKSNLNKSVLQNNRAVSCNEGPGQFQGWAMGEIVPPPGYELVGPATSKKFGTVKGVACGLPFAAASNESATSESISVTFVRSDLVS